MAFGKEQGGLLARLAQAEVAEHQQKAIIDDTRYMDKQEAEEAILAYQDLRRE